MRSNGANTGRGTRLAALLLIPMLFLCSCAGKEAKPGEPAYILDLRLIGDEVYWLGRTEGTYVLFRASAGGKESVAEFAGASDTAFCEKEACWFCTSGDELTAYYPVSGRTEKICDLKDGELLCAADDYVLASFGSEDFRIGIRDGEMRKAENMPDTEARILDIRGNEVFVWDDSRNAILRYDAESDSDSVVFSRERNPGIVMVAGLLHDGSFYYAESRGGLHRAAGGGDAADTQVFKGFVIALAEAEGGMIAAVNKDSDIVFFLLSEEDEVKEIAVWHGARYVVNGSCLLRVSGGKIVCAVTSGPEIFECEIPDEG